MKQLLCILLLVTMKFTLHAQQLFVVDSNGLAVNAKVEAINLNNSKTYKPSGTNGLFTLPLPGLYKIHISAVGFEDHRSTQNIQSNQIVKILLSYVTVAIEDVVVTAQIGNKSPRNSVIPVRVIDNKKIELMGAQNLRDVLTNEAGIRISQDNILGSSISMQGISGENVKILIDGVPMIGRQNGNIDLSQIDMSNVERIEIIEGPMSVNYGTNALGGVINIIMKKGSAQKNSIALKSYYETIGTYNLGLTANTHIKKLVLQINASRNFFDGWSPNDRYEAFPMRHLADTNRVKVWKPKEQYNTGITLGYKFKYWDLKYKSNYFNESILNRGMPQAPYYEEAFDDTYLTNRLDNVLMANYSKKAGNIFSSQFAYNYYKRIKNTYYTDLTNLEKALTTNPGDQDTTKFNLVNLRSSFISKFKKLNYEIGEDINVENAAGQRIQNNFQSQGDYAVFAIGEYSVLPSLTLRGGIRAAYNSKYHAPVLPSVNAKWFINSRNIIRVSYAEGFKAPGLKELYFYFVDFNHNIIGNTNLKAETSHSINLQYNYITMFSKMLVKFEVKTFYNDISNLITLAQIKGASYTYVNIGKYKTEGIQFRTDFTIKNLSLNAGVNYVGRYNDLSTSHSVPSFSFSPEYQGSVSYNWTKYKTRFNLFYKFNGKLPAYLLDNQNVVIQNIGSYHWADASVTKTFYKNLSIGTGVKNIFNIQDITNSTGTGFHQADNKMPIGAGRFYFFSVNYLLQK